MRAIKVRGTSSTERVGHVLYALCDDGAVFELDKGVDATKNKAKWKSVPEIPQD